MLRAGTMDQRITIQRNTPTRGSNGEELDAWATLETVWAEAERIDGREFFGSDVKLSEHPTRFRFRHSSTNAGLTTEDRIVWRSQQWDLRSARVLGRKEAWECVGVIRNG